MWRLFIRVKTITHLTLTERDAEQLGWHNSGLSRRRVASYQPTETEVGPVSDITPVCTNTHIRNGGVRRGARHGLRATANDDGSGGGRGLKNVRAPSYDDDDDDDSCRNTLPTG